MTKEDILHHFQDINFYYNDCMMYDDLRRMLDELIAENKGEWKRISPAGIYECSCCGQNVMTSDIECYKFCHGCGADMRKGEE